MTTPTPPPEINTLAATLASEGPAAALDQLIATAHSRGEPRTLLEALLLKARYELGLPLVAPGPLATLPEPARTHYEDRYIDALRRVGRMLLDRGEIVAAWPYYRTIGEPQPVAEALEAVQLEPGDERLAPLLDVALYGGAHPLRGHRWVLEHHGTCAAITAFEHLPADPAIRGPAAAALIAAVHRQLADNLRAELARSGQVRPDPELPIPALIAGRDFLFDDDAYHIDISHLAAVVRLAPLVEDRAILLKALELCEYGRRLSPRLRYDDPPPFEKTYEDHAVYLSALLGREVESALAHFRAKLSPAGDDPETNAAVAQVLVRLLVRLGRLDEAIELADAHLAAWPENMPGVPGLAELCRRAGQFDRLADSAARRGDLAGFLAARLAASGSGPTA
ncbi:MAG: hypothetical protein KatS3mg108_0850 [Isosphaeraceae bacterium]|jgi:hypothetical protein|nr:MAG: hypothetical protein KatS3mg108_0850 [Isosphaeraceae bacterium]